MKKKMLHFMLPHYEDLKLHLIYHLNFVLKKENSEDEPLKNDHFVPQNLNSNNIPCFANFRHAR